MKNKSLIIAVIAFAFCVFTLAYAALSSTLTINGSGSISTTWCVEIDTTNSTCTATSKDSNKETVPTVTKNTSSFKVAIAWAAPGDSVTCNVRVKNCGSLNANVAMTAVKLYTTSATSTACANVTATAQATPYTGSTAGTKVPTSPVSLTTGGVTVGTVKLTPSNYAIFQFVFTYSSTATAGAGTCTFQATTTATQTT